MIELYTGIPGSGKTLCAVEKMLTYLTNGGIVATNVELRRPGIRAYLRRKGYLLHPDQIVELDTVEKSRAPQRYIPKGTKEVPNLIILDECAIHFPSREYQKTPKDFFRFCLMIRRAHTDLIMICQRANQIDKQFRNLSQYRQHHTNLKRALNLPVLGRFPWEIFLQAQFDQGDHYQYMRVKTLRKEIFQCYHTLQEVVAFDRPERKIMERKHSHVTLYHRYRYYRFCCSRLLSQVQRTSSVRRYRTLYTRIREKVKTFRGTIDDRKRKRRRRDT